MKQETPQQKKIQIGKLAVSRNAVTWLCVALIVAVIGFALYNSSPFSPRNYATEVAQPLGDALVKAGAVKRCERGNNGRGITNTTPWVQAYYSLPQDESTAINTINSIAEANGYKLTHASPGNKGHLKDTVGDEYIDKWYFDDSKDSVNTDVKAGKIEMALTVNAHGAKDVCSDPVTVDATHSVVSIDVELPDIIR